MADSRILPSRNSTFPCPSCSNHFFCSQKCLSLALKSSHATWVCKALTSLQQHPNSTLVLQQHPPGRQVQARLIVASHNLFLHTLSDIYTFFFSLHSTPDDPILEVANFLHSLISPLFPPQAQLYVDLIAQLLAKDRLNSFCLMDPYFPDGPQRSIKAYAI
ncbi:hypothetical protein JHK86_025919 [Glycine max]|nr:hypothetical protein JHK86_025919 [Glycine max]